MIKLISVLNGVFTMEIEAATGESFTTSISHVGLYAAALEANEHLQPVIVEKFSTPIEFNWKEHNNTDLIKLWATTMHRIDAAKASGFNALPMFYIPRVCVEVAGVSIATPYILAKSLHMLDGQKGMQSFYLNDENAQKYGEGVILNAVRLENGDLRVKGGIADERYLL